MRKLRLQLENRAHDKKIIYWGTTAVQTDGGRMELLARGGMSDVYAYGPNTILKLYHGHDRSYEADREYMNSKAIYEAGFSTPEPLERVEVKGRSGIVFQQLTGPTLMDMIFDRTDEILRTTAEMMAAFHKLPVGSGSHRRLPDELRTYIERAVLLSDEERGRVSRIAGALPDGCSWIHGDFNPYNIMLHHGKPMLIDFVSLCVGNALFDVAYVVMMFRHAEPPDNHSEISKRLAPLRPAIERKFLDEYARLAPFDRAALEPWLVVAAVERLHPRNNVELSQKQAYAAFIRERCNS